ncbi:DUF4019 domain-containing protein [Photobacterium ganghwense]|uniref:DUF4019 domain-containing protein n=1 Tax=Photobacterium ganghwense TaxID=320778 RepID=UPI001A8FB08E|nr:DUF4019 domain-containing protein [Photobacterium ganghwense]QSV17501.1 DUF4019 domain-containing protein [Photobacterium ganghwense]QSV17667.1 DUF4019 domain-containing protein [Photobacterium ganghwense]
MVNQELIKKLRSGKFWSQEQLAIIAGISLRTIQRVESEGKCSLESKKAIAAAFEVDVAELSVESKSIVLDINDIRNEVAISWLESVDLGEYSLSWDEAAPVFQERISSTKWKRILTQVRAPLGQNISRSVKKTSEHGSLPGVADGQYLVIHFTASFGQKSSAIETVTLQKVANKWRVAGYFIK